MNKSRLQVLYRQKRKDDLRVAISRSQFIFDARMQYLFIKVKKA